MNRYLNMFLLLLVGVFMSASVNAQTVEYTIEGEDSYGDGWNGSGHLNVFVNGVEVVSSFSVVGFSSSATFNAEVGDNVSVVFVPGSDNGENSIKILDNFGAVKFIGGFSYSNGEVINFTVPPFVEPTDFCSYAFTLKDDDNGKWGEAYLEVKVNGELYSKLAKYDPDTEEDTYQISFPDGKDVEAIFHKDGQQPSKNDHIAYTIVSPFGVVEADRGLGTLTDLDFNNFTIQCTPPEPCGIALQGDEPDDIYLGPGESEAYLTYTIVYTGDCELLADEGNAGFTGDFNYGGASQTTNVGCGGLFVTDSTAVLQTADSLTHVFVGGTDENTCNRRASLVEWVVQEDGVINFDYNIVNNSENTDYDHFGYAINLGGLFLSDLEDVNHVTELPNQDGAQGASGNIRVSPGDRFSLLVYESSGGDGWWGAFNPYDAGALTATISNFTFTPVVKVKKGDTKDIRVKLHIGTNTITPQVEGLDGPHTAPSFDVEVIPFKDPTKTLACNDLVQVSVDENCEAHIHPDMILEGGPYGPYIYYEVKIFTEMPTDFANAEPDIVGDVAPLGNYWVGVYDTLNNNNNCWGQIVVLDKMPPVIKCSDTLVNCADVDSILQLKPVIIENCDKDPKWHNKVTRGVPSCAPISELIVQDFFAVDASGNTATCNRTIRVQRNDVKITWPKNWDDLIGNHPKLLCDDDSYPLDSLGNPHPDHTGWPNGHDTNCGTLEMYYNDAVYTKKDDPYLCGKKILRYWTVVDDCKGFIHDTIQIIRITDKTPPTFSLPVADTVVVSAGAYECVGKYEVPALKDLRDVCDPNPEYRVFVSKSPAGSYPDTVQVDGEYVVTDLSEGYTTICYEATDNCDNDSTNCFVVEVRDLVPPIPVCEQYKQVSLTTDGTARVCAEDFDSGSIDNCKVPYFKVKRMDDNLGYFHDCVDFSCSDLDSVLMVTLRVYDVKLDTGDVAVDAYEGHYNDCMSNVEILCKLPPYMKCEDVPLTVDCGDLDDLEALEEHLPVPTVEGVCAGKPYHDTIVLEGGICNPKITVHWHVNGCGKTQAHCDQEIILTTDDFNPCTIIMPDDVTEYCAKDLGKVRPTWESTFCDMVTSEVIHEDTFKFAKDACYKIVREWAVIDWCIYDGLTAEGRALARDNIDYWTGDRKLACDSLYYKVNGFDGYYRYTQILMMIDDVDPEIEVSDTCIGIYSDCTVPVTLTALGTDSCNFTDKYDWKYRIFDVDSSVWVQYSAHYSDVYGGGDRVGTSGDVLTKTNKPVIKLNQPLGIGTYRVEWIVGDGCGNTDTKIQIVEVADKKAPTPLMVDIATAVMENGKVDLKARTFDKGGCDYGCISSFDNCSDKDHLYFTFGPHLPHTWEGWQPDGLGLFYFDPNSGEERTKADFENSEADAWDPVGRTAIRRYSCDSVVAGANPGRISQNIYVWDRFGVYEGSTCKLPNYDFATVLVDFNNCAGNITHALKGSAKLVETAEGVKNIKMTTMIDSEVMGYSTTDANGNFEFNLNSGDYTVYGSSDEDVLNGVSTIDIVLIQKHILGISRFKDTHDLLAADASNDGRITAADIAVIRKVILGVKNEFINNSWVALSEETGERELNISLSQDATADFTVVKIGDLNNTAGSVIESRTGGVVNFELDNAILSEGEVTEVPVYASNFADVRGGQFAMSLNGLNVEDVKAGKLNIGTSNYNVKGNNLLVSWSEVEGQSIVDGDILFTLVVKPTSDVSLRSALSIDDSRLRSEAYKGSDLEISSIDLSYRNASYALYQNTPNPFVSETTIGFELPEASAYTLTVYDVTGKLVKVINAEGEAGYNAQTISKKDLNASGVLYYRLESGDYTATKKMVILK